MKTETHNSKTILVVDDDQDCHALVEVFLQDFGYNLCFVSNGKQALEHIEQQLPNMVLLDIMMPEMDGFEVCEALRAAGHKELTIIFISARFKHADIRRGLEVGGNGYVRKPFSKSQLRNEVKKHIYP
ncbi:MAG: response regulator [Zetaproteobacteria bacterium]|nr:response regulator [Zetaproteobacteria bacterium]